MRAGALKSAALIGFGALLLHGPLRAEPSDDLAGPSAGTNIELVDPALDGKIEIMRIDSNRGGNNLLQVVAALRNKSPHRLNLEIETIYKDSSGNDLNTGSWIHLSLDPHAEQDYRSAAISEAAVDFLIRVRVAHASR